MRGAVIRWVGLAGAMVAAQVASAQPRTLQFDLNNLAYQSLNASGAPVPFGGLTHTGSLAFSDSLPTTQLVAILISTAGGPFVNQPGAPWNLTDCVLNVNLSNGNVTGGSFSVDLNGGPGGGGDRYSAAIGAAGNVSTYVGGGFKVEGLTMNGAFSDALYGTVNVADFFAAQGTPPFLQGSFLSFRIQPDANGAGFADTDAFVSSVPEPGSLACLLAAAAIVVRRRRRS
jgi:hypothetical protein